jgi:hypothetical protein
MLRVVWCLGHLISLISQLLSTVKVAGFVNRPLICQLSCIIEIMPTATCLLFKLLKKIKALFGNCSWMA